MTAVDFTQWIYHWFIWTVELIAEKIKKGNCITPPSILPGGYYWFDLNRWILPLHLGNWITRLCYTGRSTLQYDSILTVGSNVPCAKHFAPPLIIFSKKEKKNLLGYNLYDKKPCYDLIKKIKAVSNFWCLCDVCSSFFLRRNLLLLIESYAVFSTIRSSAISGIESIDKKSI